MSIVTRSTNKVRIAGAQCGRSNSREFAPDDFAGASPRLANSPSAKKAPIGLATIGLGTVALILAWLIATWSLADRLTGHPRIALMLSPNNSEALVRLALQKLSADGSDEAEPDVDMAEKLAQRALVLNPLSASALRVLAFAAAKREDEAGSAKLMQLGAKRSLRDAYMQGWLIDRMLRAGEIESALYHIDGLLRAQLAYDSLFPTLMSIALNPGGVEPFARLLATNPTWRSWFVQNFINQAQDPLAFRPLMQAMKDFDGNLTDRELRAYLVRLLGSGLFTEAREIWLNRLPEEMRRPDAFVFNGDFENAPIEAPFDWQLRSTPGDNVSIASPAARGGNKALLIEFNANKISFNQIYQTVMLPPGAYRFNVQAKADALRNDRGLWWKVTCLGQGAAAVLGTTNLLRGSTPWMTLGFDFVIPDDCKAQRILLELPARAILEQRIEGRVWFDEVKIFRIENTTDTANVEH